MSNIMKKNQQNRRFIESCYYKFRVNRSLKTHQSNPLLVPNKHIDNCLAATVTQKYNIHYHNKTISGDWGNSLSQSTILQITKNQKNKLSPRKGNLEIKGQVTASKFHKNNYANKIKYQASELKKERCLQLKPFVNYLNSLELQHLTKNNDHLTISTQNKSIVKKLSTGASSKCQKSIIHRKQKLRTSSQSSILVWKNFPYKVQRRSPSQAIKNQSKLSFRGWDSSLCDNQEESNINCSKYIRK